MTLPSPKITQKLLTVPKYGFPSAGDPRRINPLALACIHITDNPSTPPATALQEWANVNNNPGSRSASHYVDRTGSAIEAIDWRQFAAWSNGDVRSPDLSVPGISAVMDRRAAGFNANECYAVEIENCGREPGYPLTESQLRTNGFIIAKAAVEYGKPIDRSTVHAHRYLNSETRADCPTSGDVKALIDRIIYLGNVWAEILSLREDLAATADLLVAEQAAYEELQKTTDDRIRGMTEQIGDLNTKMVDWNAYADAVASDAGSILGRDRP